MPTVPSQPAPLVKPEESSDSELDAEEKGLPQVSQPIQNYTIPADPSSLVENEQPPLNQGLRTYETASERAAGVRADGRQEPILDVHKKGLREVSQPLQGVDGNGAPNRLSEDQKLFIVQQLAMYRTPTETAALVKVKFGKDVSRQAVRRYSPEARRVGKKWREIFDTTRQKYLQEIADIGVADPVYRLRILQECLDHEKSKPVPDKRIIFKIIAHAAFEAAGRPPVERGDLTRGFQFLSF